MSTIARPLVLLVSCLSLGLALPACGKSRSGGKQAKARTLSVKVGGAAAPGSVTANVGEFDPNADVTLDLDKYGSERPDEFEVQQAFFAQFEAIDGCVVDHKRRAGLEDDAVLTGDVALAVKLNPEQSTPYGVNATMPEPYAEADNLRDCLRNAAADAPYPTYDGPSVVVDFEFELDPGYE